MFFNGLYCNFINVPLGTVFANPVTYCSIKRPHDFYEVHYFTKFYNGYVLNISARAIMSDFHKLVHICMKGSKCNSAHNGLCHMYNSVN